MHKKSIEFKAWAKSIERMSHDTESNHKAANRYALIVKEPIYIDGGKSVICSIIVAAKKGTSKE